MNVRHKIIAAAVAVCAIGAVSSVAVARDKGGFGGGHHGGMHSEAAVTACANQTEGANVQMTLPMWDVSVNAVCAKSPKGDKLVAMPAKMVEHRKAAIAACVGKKSGDKVTINDFNNAGKTLEASCKTKHGDVLSAHPNNGGGWGNRK